MRRDTGRNEGRTTSCTLVEMFRGRHSGVKTNAEVLIVGDARGVAPSPADSTERGRVATFPDRVCDSTRKISTSPVFRAASICTEQITPGRK